jgi:hypothetical protein
MAPQGYKNVATLTTPFQVYVTNKKYGFASLLDLLIVVF